jgi:ribose transport system substrate-binding protein
MTNCFLRKITGARAAAAVVAVLVALAALPGCDRSGSGSGVNIAYITNGVADFWTIAEVGARNAGKEINVNVDVLMPKNIEDQKRMVEDSLARGADGIAISPINPANQGDLINKAAAQTKLITHDSDAPGTNRLCYIGMDNYDAGRLCGKLVKEALPDGGNIVILVGRIEQDNARRRRQGLIDELLDRPNDPERYDPPGQQVKGDKYVILETLTDQFDRDLGKRNAQDAMGKYSNVNGMVGLFEYNPPLILEALGPKAGKQIQVIGFDEADATLQAIREGRCHGTVVQDPYRYGYESVKMLAALKKGDQSVIPPNKFMDIPAQRITKENVEQFWAEKNKRLGKPAPAATADAR